MQYGDDLIAQVHGLLANPISRRALQLGLLLFTA